MLPQTMLPQTSMHPKESVLARTAAAIRSAALRFFSSRRATINTLASMFGLALVKSFASGHFDKTLFVTALAASLTAFMQQPHNNPPPINNQPPTDNQPPPGNGR